MTKHLIVAGIASLLAASPALAQRGRAAGAGPDANAAAAAKPTPRAADGHPDLTGVWARRRRDGESAGTWRINTHPVSGADRSRRQTHLRRDGSRRERAAGRRTEQAAVQDGAAGKSAAPVRQAAVQRSGVLLQTARRAAHGAAQPDRADAGSRRAALSGAQHVPHDPDRRPTAQCGRRLDVEWATRSGAGTATHS